MGDFGFDILDSNDKAGEEVGDDRQGNGGKEKGIDSCYQDQSSTNVLDWAIRDAGGENSSIS